VRAWPVLKLVWFMAAAGCGADTWAFEPIDDAAATGSSSATSDDSGSESKGDRFCDGGACLQCQVGTDCPTYGRYYLCIEARCVPACDDAGCAVDTPCVVQGGGAGCQDPCEAGVCWECTTDSDCIGSNFGGVCARGRCVECQYKNDCTTQRRPICDEVNNRCVECVYDSDCPVAVTCNVLQGTCTGSRDF
jgi:hypothetical protein